MTTINHIKMKKHNKIKNQPYNNHIYLWFSNCNYYIIQSLSQFNIDHNL